MMAESTETEVEAEPKKAESLPSIPVSDFQARILSGAVTFIFTVYLTTLFLVFVAMPCLKLLARLLGLPRF